MLANVLDQIIKLIESRVPITCRGYLAQEVNDVLELYRNGVRIKGGISDSLGNYFYIKKSGNHTFKNANDKSCNENLIATTRLDLIAVSDTNENIALSFINELLRFGRFSYQVINNGELNLISLNENYSKIFLEENKIALKKNKNIIKIGLELDYNFNSIDTTRCKLNLCKC